MLQSKKPRLKLLLILDSKNISKKVWTFMPSLDLEYLEYEEKEMELGVK